MFECQYCKTQFLKQENFDKHKCNEETRLEELTTGAGQRAFRYYRLWFKKRKFKEPEQEIFIASKHYKVFFKFEEFARDMMIPDTELYIEHMSKENILPQQWYNTDIYNFFMDYMDKECPPNKNVEITIRTLDGLSDVLECNISNVFDHLRPTDVWRFIKTRNLSPWLLLFSEKFKTFIATVANPEERRLIEGAINIPRWRNILETKRNYIPKMKKYIKQLDL